MPLRNMVPGNFEHYICVFSNHKRYPHFLPGSLSSHTQLTSLSHQSTISATHLSPLYSPDVFVWVTFSSHLFWDVLKTVEDGISQLYFPNCCHAGLVCKLRRRSTLDQSSGPQKENYFLPCLNCEVKTLISTSLVILISTTFVPGSTPSFTP